jgi:two-component system, OmpR family, heavy metal sensor histidine kinase CusS
MFSNHGTSAWALSTRLFIWYSVATSVLTGVTIGSLYLAMTVQLDKEADSWLRESAKYFEEHRSEALDQTDEWGMPMAQVTDASGNVLSASPQLLRLFDVNSFPKDGAAGIDRTSVDGRVFRLLHVKEGDHSILLAQDRGFEREIMTRFRRNIVITAGPTLVISLAVGYFLARLGMRPVKEIIAAFRAVSPAHLHGRVPVVGQPADLRQLAETLNSVLEKMQEAFGRLDAFSSDVAHELKTPVQNLRGSIEVALGQERTCDDYRQTLLISLNEVERLARLVDRLLLLAQCEDPRREVRCEQVDVKAELEEVREFFSGQAGESSIELEVDCDDVTDFSLERGLFQRAISNLVANALAHTPRGGRISLRGHTDSNVLTIEVSDTGEGIDQNELPYLFDRFYRSESVRNSGRGVGLGLAIVKRVVDLHSGQIKICSNIGMGTTVTMTFPR